MVNDVADDDVDVSFIRCSRRLILSVFFNNRNSTYLRVCSINNKTTIGKRISLGSKLKMRWSYTSILLAQSWAAIASVHFVECFTIANTLNSSFDSTQRKMGLSAELGRSVDNIKGIRGDDVDAVQSRREMMAKTTALASMAFLPGAIGLPQTSSAVVGALPEYADTNAIVQGLTINVADASQQKSMIEFLIGSFSFEVQRQRIQGTVEETVSRRCGLLVFFTFETKPSTMIFGILFSQTTKHT